MPGPVRESQEILDRYAELEAIADAKRAARLKRQPLILISIFGVLTLGVGITASIDFRRLQTPGGVALRWTQATLFGDCDAYQHYSVGTVTDGRSRAQVCTILRADTKAARDESASVGIRLHGVHTSGSHSTVGVEVTQKQKATDITLHLVHRSGRWIVLRETAPCLVLRCAYL